MNNTRLLGKVVSFPENKINFFQDFRWFKGVPTGIEFLIEKEAGHNDYWLVADGYGNLDKPNCYGNGAIAVKEKDIIWALSQ